MAIHSVWKSSDSSHLGFSGSAWLLQEVWEDFKHCSRLSALFCMSTHWSVVLGNILCIGHIPWFWMLCTVPLFMCNGSKAEEDLCSLVKFLFAVVSCKTKKIVGWSLSAISRGLRRCPAWLLSKTYWSCTDSAAYSEISGSLRWVKLVLEQHGFHSHWSWSFQWIQTVKLHLNSVICTNFPPNCFIQIAH